MNVRAFLLAVGVSLSPLTVSACAFHLPSSEGPPGTSWNLIQSQLAIKTGLISPIKALGEDAAHRRAMWWLNLLNNRVDAEALGDIYVYVSDLGLWSHHVSREERPRLGIQPNDDSHYYIITSAVLHSVLEGKISIAEGLALEIITFSGDSIV